MKGGLLFAGLPFTFTKSSGTFLENPPHGDQMMQELALPVLGFVTTLGLIGLGVAQSGLLNLLGIL